MNKSFTTAMTRLCGHEDSVSTSYGKRTRETNRNEARNTLCKECSARLLSLSATSQEDSYRVNPVIMRGSPKKASWATDIRRDMLRKYGPVMSELAKMEGDHLAKVALKAYELLFLIPTADFWIDSRNSQFSGYWLVGEVQHLMQSFEQIGQRYSPQSVYGFWRAGNILVINEARRALAADETPAAAQG